MERFKTECQGKSDCKIKLTNKGIFSTDYYKLPEVGTLHETAEDARIAYEKKWNAD
jgi:hypothetical protein